MLLTRWAILDLATAPIADCQDFIDEPTAPANYKDPIKIADYIAEKRAKLIADAALDVDLARITAIGLLQDDMDEPQITTCDDDDAECRELVSLLDDLDGRTIITFNGFRYDLPLIGRRCLYNTGVPLPSIDTDRYRSPHVDIWQRLSHHGQVDAHSLVWYAKRFGWTDLEKPLSGAEEALAALEGRWDEVRASVRHDVLCIARLASRMGIVDVRRLVAVTSR